MELPIEPRFRRGLVSKLRVVCGVTTRWVLVNVARQRLSFGTAAAPVHTIPAILPNRWRAEFVVSANV